MSIRKLLSAGVVSCAVLAGGMIEARELRLVTIAPESHNFTGIARQIASELEARPELDLQLSVFAGAQLGGEPETLQQVELGLIDMGLFTVASLVTRAPSLNGWFTPYLFEDVASAGDARHLPAAQAMLDELEDAGLVGLDVALAGLRHILSRGAPVRDVGDLARSKIRITPFDAANIWWSALDAVATPVAAPALYQALQTGVVDLVETDLDLLNSLSLYEVADGLTLTSHMAFPAVILVSQDIWNDLTPEQQEGLREAVTTATAAGINAQIEAEVTNLAAVSTHLEVVEPGEDPIRFTAGEDAFAASFGNLPLVTEFQQQVRDGQD